MRNQHPSREPEVNAVYFVKSRRTPVVYVPSRSTSIRWKNMIRYLTENDVTQLLTMPIALRLVEEALKARAAGRATDVPRVRTRTPQGTLHVLQASSQDLNRIGFKAYYSSSTGTRFHVHLYDLAKGPHEAMVEANYLGIVRTGAASGVATRYLAREDASIVAAIGAGTSGGRAARSGVRSMQSPRSAGMEPQARNFTRSSSTRWRSGSSVEMRADRRCRRSGQGRAHHQRHDQSVRARAARRMARAGAAYQRRGLEFAHPPRARPASDRALRLHHGRFARDGAQRVRRPSARGRKRYRRLGYA